MNNGPIDLYPFDRKIPEGDTRERHVCNDCGWINYVNPKIVAGAVVTHGEKFLLCRRSIEPRSGYWTIPAGYMEEGESPLEGALREAREEACACIEIDALLAVYSIPRISQVQMIYRASLPDGKFAAGEETEEAMLCSWEEIPWEELAFPTVNWALNQHRLVAGRSDFQPFTNPGQLNPPEFTGRFIDPRK